MVLDEFERRVREGLIAPSTPVRFSVLTGERWVEARDLELYRQLYAPVRIHFTQAFSLGRFPVLTTLLCLMQIGLYISMGGTQHVLPLDVLVAAGAKLHANIFELGETWRLLTANVLHRDVLHLFFNMLFLFNVGGTIENVYRWQDYLLIVVVAALSTTLLSVTMSDRASVGASGVVLGTFGAASVFGYKYAELLPLRYRRYFGGAVLPYALFILYLGLVSENTDNWGHLGGFAGGIIAAVPLTPRLLYVGPPRGPVARDWASVGLASGLVIATLVAGPIVRRLDVPVRTLVTSQVGLQLAIPARWRGEDTNHLGYPCWSNLLGVKLGVSHERAIDGPVSVTELRRRFMEDELRAREVDGDIADVTPLQERTMLIDGGKALVVDIALESRAGPQLTRNLLIERGYYSFKIVMSAPSAWFADYESLFERLARAVVMVDTDGLVHSRRVVETFPGMSSARVEMADQLALLGEVDRADGMYRSALEALPDLAEAEYGLARLAIDYGRPLAEAERRATALNRRYPEDATYAGLLADIRQRLGQMDSACAVLQQTLDRTSDPSDDLRARIRALRCRSGGWLDRE